MWLIIPPYDAFKKKPHTKVHGHMQHNTGNWCQQNAIRDKSYARSCCQSAQSIRKPVNPDCKCFFP